MNTLRIPKSRFLCRKSTMESVRAKAVAYYAKKARAFNAATAEQPEGAQYNEGLTPKRAPAE